ncbi:hypothetical protein ZMO02_06980 [Zymomonas mobilis subsp. pomaceae]|nr:hypothetical protein ZMO02_06980 [Zymomonas mobilis subsp. pomaceae]
MYLPDWGGETLSRSAALLSVASDGDAAEDSVPVSATAGARKILDRISGMAVSMSVLKYLTFLLNV